MEKSLRRNYVQAIGTCSKTHTWICSRSVSSDISLDLFPIYYYENAQTYNTVERSRERTLTRPPPKCLCGHHGGRQSGETDESILTEREGGGRGVHSTSPPSAPPSQREAPCPCLILNTGNRTRPAPCIRQAVPESTQKIPSNPLSRGSQVR